MERTNALGIDGTATWGHRGSGETTVCAACGLVQWAWPAAAAMLHEAAAVRSWINFRGKWAPASIDLAENISYTELIQRRRVRLSPNKEGVPNLTNLRHAASNYLLIGNS